ncbi:MAG TPA: SseB family protein [Gammaproteobacteria bacterium]|nr:SseB family protein [Gammaproteobacteria bacterium]
MTELDQAISKAYQSGGTQQDASQVYLILLRSTLFLPVKKEMPDTAKKDEPFYPLYAVIEGNCFMLAFDTLDRLTHWAKDEMARIDYVEITGRDLVAGMNEKIFLVLNIESECRKEFSPDEVMHLKKLVAKIDQLKGSPHAGL